jgi:hypothetical protein
VNWDDLPGQCRAKSGAAQYETPQTLTATGKMTHTALEGEDAIDREYIVWKIDTWRSK